MVLTAANLEWLVARLDIIINALLIAKLLKLRLDRVYRVFFWFLAVALAGKIVLIVLPPGQNLYSIAWFCIVAVGWVLYVLVILELYSLVLKDYAGLLSVGRWSLTAALALSVVTAAITLGPDVSHAAGPYPILETFLIIHRAVVSSLAVFLLLITGFLAWCPVSLRRNVVVYLVFYFVFFLAETFSVFARNILGEQAMHLTNVATLVVSTVCMLAWTLLLSREGELANVRISPRGLPGQERATLQQLRTLNQALLRSIRKEVR